VAPPKFGTATVTVFGVDVDAAGNESLRIIPEAVPGGKENPASVEGVPLGRWKFFTAKLGNTPATPTPLTREYRAVHSNGVFGTPVCNGLIAGQFQLPCFDFVTPEHLVFGDPVYPGNYQDLNFLVTGNVAGGAPMGRLDPWPGNFPDNQPAP
jgi:hypothetical protein